ncbi:MAG: FAD-dependent monooxygenase [Streptosporangiaceae bacterium]|nr:FAD-dependent monooxygenase [Streptosporangiaceae bacterium]
MTGAACDGFFRTGGVFASWAEHYAMTVAIVGAGPAGLVVAHLLQREAIPFVVFERHPLSELCRRPKAGLIEYRTVQLLAREGIAGPILQFSAENHRCEFRTPDESVVLDYGTLTGGRPHYIYPQHLLVQGLCEALIAAGGQIRFGHTVRAVTQDSGGVLLSIQEPDGSSSEVRCEAAVGCEGSRSPVAAAMTGARVSEQSLPVRWLVILGEAPPMEDHTIYAAHPRGFAGQMRRGPAQTRYMLEIPATDTVADWPRQRVRDELAARLGADGRLDDVPVGDLGVLDLRVRVIEPMQQGPLLLAGDAAHLITPAGGKGMNLAVQDAVELAHGLIDRFGPKRDGGRLSGYSRTRLPPVWRTEAFSSWFLHVILTSLRDGKEPPGAVPGGFANGLRRSWIAALRSDPLFARWFAHAYVGVDPP